MLYTVHGTKELAKTIVEAMEDRSAALVTNHVAICIGKNPHAAFDNALLPEHARCICSHNRLIRPHSLRKAL
ncbi:MAG: hypothetical protein EAX81_02235 [Candidatus Thorarchaeota archaeon]|nr:hypothetical protein [Candidatus Thorarchaeota archaeon]